MGLGDEQDRFGSFPSPNRTEKVPPAGGGVAPMQAMPAHIIALCTDSNGKQTSKTSTAEAIPLPPLCYALPAVLFLAFRIARTGRKNNRIYMTQKQSRKQTQRKSKSKENKQSGKASHTQTRSRKSKQKRKQTAQARELASVLAIIIQAKQITPL